MSVDNSDGNSTTQMVTDNTKLWLFCFGRIPWVFKPHPFPESHIIYFPFCFSCRSYISQQCYNIDIFLPRRTKYAVNQSAYEIFEKPSSDFC